MTTVVHSEPFAVGDQVLVWGRRGVIEHIAHSLAAEGLLLTVSIDPRIRLRVRAVDVTRPGAA